MIKSNENNNSNINPKDTSALVNTSDSSTNPSTKEIVDDKSNKITKEN